MHNPTILDQLDQKHLFRIKTNRMIHDIDMSLTINSVIYLCVSRESRIKIN